MIARQSGQLIIVLQRLAAARLVVFTIAAAVCAASGGQNSQVFGVVSAAFNDLGKYLTSACLYRSCTALACFLATFDSHVIEIKDKKRLEFYYPINL